MSESKPHKKFPGVCRHDGYKSYESSYARGQIKCCKCGKVLYERGPIK